MHSDSVTCQPKFRSYDRDLSFVGCLAVVVASGCLSRSGIPRSGDASRVQLGVECSHVPAQVLPQSRGREEGLLATRRELPHAPRPAPARGRGGKGGWRVATRAGSPRTRWGGRCGSECWSSRRLATRTSVTPTSARSGLCWVGSRCAAGEGKPGSRRSTCIAPPGIVVADPGNWRPG